MQKTKVNFLYDAENKKFIMDHNDPENIIPDITILAKKVYEGLDEYAFDDVWGKILEIGVAIYPQIKEKDNITPEKIGNLVSALIADEDDTFICMQVDEGLDAFDIQVGSSNRECLLLGLATLYFMGIIFGHKDIDMNNVDAFKDILTASSHSIERTRG